MSLADRCIHMFDSGVRTRGQQYFREDRVTLHLPGRSDVRAFVHGESEYEVLLDRPYVGAKDTPKLLRGVSTEHGRAKAESVRQLSPTVLRIVLRQGLKRQIRMMLYKVGYEVERLIRIRIGPLRLTELHAGEWRLLTAAEVKALRAERPEPSPGVKEVVRPGKPKPGPGGTKVRPVRKGKPGSGPDGTRPRGTRRPPPSRTKINGKRSVSSTPRAVRRP